MKNQERARGPVDWKANAKEDGYEAGKYGRLKRNTRHRWNCVSGCTMAFQDFLICMSSHSSFQISVKQQFKPH